MALRAKNDTQSKAQLIFTTGCICLGVSVLLVIWYVAKPPATVRTFTINGSQLQITEEPSASQINYQLGEEIELSARAFDLRVVEGFEPFGARAMFTYLPEPAYQNVLAIRKAQKVCPAPFINSKAKHLLFVTDEGALAEELSSMRVKEGDDIRLKGVYLKFENGTLRGNQVMGTSSSFSYFLLRSITIAGQK